LSRKKNKNIKKPRMQIIEFDFVANNDNNISGKGMTIPFNDSNFLQLHNDNGPIMPANIKSYSAYERKTKLKILNFNTNPISLCPNRSLLQYSHIYGIDTNSKYINGKLNVIGVLTKMQLISSNSMGGEAKFIVKQIMGWEYDDAQENLEQQSWVYGCRYILNETAVINLPKIALIVDCDLGKIELYNERTMPIFEDYYLPPIIKLFYGSADVGKEYIANSLISFTDKKASEYLSMKINGTLNPIEK